MDSKEIWGKRERENVSQCSAWETIDVSHGWHATNYEGVKECGDLLYWSEPPLLKDTPLGFCLFIYLV